MDLYVKVLQNLNQEQIQFATFVFLFGFGVVAPQFGLYLWVLSCVGAQSPEDKGLAENRLDGPGVAIRLFRSVSIFDQDSSLSFRAEVRASMTHGKL